MSTWSAKMAKGDVSSYCRITRCHSKQCTFSWLKTVSGTKNLFCLHTTIFYTLISLTKLIKFIYRYPSFYEHSIYKCSLQRSVLISTYFSFNEFHFCYNKELTFPNILTHMHLPPSQSVCATHDHTESALLLTLHFYV
jgi:hypothetical protein